MSGIDPISVLACVGIMYFMAGMMIRPGDERTRWMIVFSVFGFTMLLNYANFFLSQ